MQTNIIYNKDSIQQLNCVDDHSIHLILSDIPYGIGIDDWDVLHNNTNSSYLGASPSQKDKGAIFCKRGKPLNGWCAQDKKIPLQYEQWCSSFSSQWYNKMIDGGNVFIFAGRRLSHRCVTAFENSGFIFKDMIAWDKIIAPYRAQRLNLVYERRGDMQSANKWKNWRIGNLRPIFQPILWFMKPYPIGTTLSDNILINNIGGFNDTILSKYNQLSNNFFHIQSLKSDRGLHVTQKPLELMKLLIELVTIENQIILDPFCGSGTSLLASLLLNRKYIGFEKNERYYNISLKRVQKSL